MVVISHAILRPIEPLAVNAGPCVPRACILKPRLKSRFICFIKMVTYETPAEIPLWPSTRSSNGPDTLARGCSIRFLPTRLDLLANPLCWVLSADSFSKRAEPTALQAKSTLGANNLSSLPVLSKYKTPLTELEGSVRILVTRVLVKSLAPAFIASGQYVISVLAFALCGQFSSQGPQWLHWPRSLHRVVSSRPSLLATMTTPVH